MTKDEYLKGAPGEFAQWLAARLADKAITHSYVRRDGELIELAGLEAGLARYDWPFDLELPGFDGRFKGSTYLEAEPVLEHIHQGLADALSKADPTERTEATRDWALFVLEWGRVTARNKAWVFKHQASLPSILSQTANALRQGDDDVIFSRGQRLVRFNSGMSKIYSLLVPDFVIYDSRVAAALGWLIVHWCRDTGQLEVPETLRFRWLPSRQPAGSRRALLRNPSVGGLKFPRQWSSARMYARSNLRASWVLSEALRQSEGTAFHAARKPLRALEAALFTLGYDLTPA